MRMKRITLSTLEVSAALIHLISRLFSQIEEEDATIIHLNSIPNSVHLVSKLEHSSLEVGIHLVSKQKKFPTSTLYEKKGVQQTNSFSNLKSV